VHALERAIDLAGGRSRRPRQPDDVRGFHSITSWTSVELQSSAAEEVAMVNPTIKEQILSDLDRLSPEEQARAAEFVHSLASQTPKGIPGRDLRRFAGILDPESAREMIEAIEEGCERVDLDEW
jgi:hypothetical protein